MNVLIVDDDKLARKGLIAIMDWEKYGFKVAEMYRTEERLWNFSVLIRWTSCLRILICRRSMDWN